jgi:hypothetical protein
MLFNPVMMTQQLMHCIMQQGGVSHLLACRPQRQDVFGDVLVISVVVQ